MATEIRETHFQDVVSSAASAADRHDTHKLFHIINAHAPKSQKRQVQLRNTAGVLATPIECMSILNKFVHDTWNGPRRMRITFTQPPGVPFTVQQLVTALAAIPVTKAVAKPFAPGVVWKQQADHMGPLLHALLCQWWSTCPPIIPDAWRNGWLVLIPKPLKIPSCPQHLRPLALQEPVGKAVMGLLIRLALKQAMPCITPWPVWAYLEHRSTSDAIHRVALHCQSVRRLIGDQRSTPHQRARGITRFSVYGGLQVCIDLQRAFDCVNREKLFCKLHHLSIDANIIQLLTEWHMDTQYIVQHDTADSPIFIGRGVRQGCKAAPGLWTFFLILWLHELVASIPFTWVQNHLNIYADDFHVGSTFTSWADFEFLRQTIGILFHTLASLDLQMNPQKSVAILKIKGQHSRKLLQHCVRRDHTGQSLKIDMPHADPVYIPIHRQTKYLGVVISYDSFEHDTLRHRISLMHVGFQRLKRWLTGRHSLNIKRRFQLWQTCVYPILSYGIFATGTSQSGIRLAIMHMTKMLRLILHDHPYITHRTHRQVFQHHSVPSPIALLHGTVTGLIESVTQRRSQLATHDLVLTLHWHHLTDIQQQLATLQASASVEPVHSIWTLSHEATSNPPYQCAICPFSTIDVHHFRRHCTIIHGLTLFRTRQVHASDFFVDGLPECKLCGKCFTTWRSFQNHIERGCQAVISGPALCVPQAGQHLSDTLPSVANMSSPDAAVRGNRMIQATDLENLHTLEFGTRLLQLIQDRSWEALEAERDACQYLSSRCIVCAQHFTRIQEMRQHYRQHHPDLWEHVPLKAQQLTNIHSQEAPCGVCGALFKTHTCPVWSQVAMLLVNGACSDPTLDSALRCRCEICGDCFATAADLTQHLQTQHGLHGLTEVQRQQGCPGPQSSLRTLWANLRYDEWPQNAHSAGQMQLLQSHGQCRDQTD